MEKPDRRSQSASDGSLAVPLDVRLEVAKQNQRLAEVRYTWAVKRGQAWNAISRHKRA